MAATVVATGLAVPSASASTPVAATTVAAAPQHASAITVVLEPQQPRVLSRLAAQQSGGRPQRLAALTEALPSAVERSQVAGILAGRGFTVIGETAWTIQATADPATVAGSFGTRPTLPEQHTAAQFRAATGALPDLPTALQGLASGVYPTTTGPAVFHHSATSVLGGADIRKADAPAHVAPSRGRHDGRLTIATLQLASFRSSDLSAYARNNHLADPVRSHRYRAVSVDGGPLPGSGGAVEVALDQESLVSTAPTARQSAYFAPNTNGGYIDALAAVAGAAIKNPHLVALSISWGGCEALTGSAFIHRAEPVLRSLVAAGVTVFAATGDNGIYDCGSFTGTGFDDHQADVDFPASSPQVVAVGGTRLRAPATRPNTGRNWTEQAWSCGGASSCEDTATGTGGTGGGVSGSAFRRPVLGGFGDFAGFAEPSWQKRAITSGPYAATRKRMVPDIAADADPRTGFRIFSSDPSWRAAHFGSHSGIVGGTSLSAPLSAAQLTNTLGDAGRATGVGDIHPALYRAYAATRHLRATNRRRVFRDVTVGSNGAPGDQGADPSVGAAGGYDTVSGLGGVLWSALRPYLPHVVRKPSVTAHLATVRAASTRRSTAVRFRWTATRGHDPHALRHRSAVVRVGHRTRFRSHAAHGSRLLHVRPGTRVTAVVTAVDRAGRRTTRTVHLTAPTVRR